MKITISFELRTEKVDSKGNSPILANISVAGSRKRLSTGITLNPIHWDKENQQSAYVPKTDLYKDDVRRINEELESIRKKLNGIADTFKTEGTTYTVQTLIDRFKQLTKPEAVKETKDLLLVDFIDSFTEDIRTTKNPGTVKVYTTTRNHIASFEKKKRTKTALKSAGYGFMQGFYNYLIETVGHKNITAAKQITTLKTFISNARKYGHEINNTYQDFNVKREDLEVIALTNEEFLTLYNLDLSSDGNVIIEEQPKLRTITHKTLAKIRDTFCFSCVTGLRFSDLKQLSREHIKTKEGVIRLTVTKTREPIEIPLNGYATAILSRYRLQIRPLPVISSQKFNDYLKILCRHAGIDDILEIVRYKGVERIVETQPKHKLISAHTGRKTFATLSLEKGMNAEETMAITGHKSYKSFKRYVNVTKERKKAVMAMAWGKPELLTKVK